MQQQMGQDPWSQGRQQGTRLTAPPCPRRTGLGLSYLLIFARKQDLGIGVWLGVRLGAPLGLEHQPGHAAASRG